MKTDKKWAASMSWSESNPHEEKDAFGNKHMANDGYCRMTLVSLDGSGELHRFCAYPDDWGRNGFFGTDWVCNNYERKLPEWNGLSPAEFCEYHNRCEYMPAILMDLFGINMNEIEWV